MGVHCLQPPRKASHEILSDIGPIPQGNTDWTDKADKQCYTPLANSGFFGRASYDIYGVLQTWLEANNSETNKKIQSSLADNGVGDCFSHVILPDISREDKTILIRAGLNKFRDASGGAKPKFFWPPEKQLLTPKR